MRKSPQSTVKLQVAVLGPLGTYTHEAAFAKFGTQADYNEQQTIAGVFHALSETIPLGVVPQENSIFGNVIETYDALQHAGFVRGEITLKVQHCLLVRKGVKMDDIQKIMSHEQALGQCQDFIADKFPAALTEKMPSTASAARALLENPPNCAAICSKICAHIFEGLEVLREGIQKEALNFTRFYIITRSQNTPTPPLLLMTCSRTALLRLTAPLHSARHGTLLSHLNSLQLNVIRIDRRPLANSISFHDMYYVEIRGNSDGNEDSWVLVVNTALQRVRSSGGEVDLAGIW
ncbi:Prephenate dehydratase-domain-containing protein [Crucibulum laeve]|uniref:prephenate dehydratase n=1 Tax=Crucibulum laeve TaxID=68775 RepID=A0A5C3MIP1_9AGAR|nr:Prephenate dehydratase-domain-containing protein [Crucibulum laeve]